MAFPSQLAACFLLLVGASRADNAVGNLDAGDPDAGDQRTLLERLNTETEALYGEVSRGLVRVQLPPPRAPNEPATQESPLTKYELAPGVRRELEQRRLRASRGRAVATSEGERVARVNPPQLAARFATDAGGRGDSHAAVIVVPPPARAPGAPAPADSSPAFAPNNVALVLDDRGHVLVPLHLDRQTAEDQPVRFAGPDGAVSAARFVGSDRQTNLTVLQLPRPPGTPVRLSDGPPRDGSLVLLVAPHDAAGRLGVWTGGGRDVAVVFSIDGRCAGVARPGQFLAGRACRLIAEQIIRHGAVPRATLGVIITEVRADDPQHGKSPLLADRSAMRIDQVMPGSAAEKAGLQVGDVLLALAGEAVHDIPSLAAAIAARNGMTELQVLRGDEVLKVNVNLQQK